MVQRSSNHYDYLIHLSSLRAFLYSVASKKKVTKVQVIVEAVKYIEKLHAALIERFREKHGSMAEGKAQETVRTFKTLLAIAEAAKPYLKKNLKHDGGKKSLIAQHTFKYIKPCSLDLSKES
ncbi:hypothetical protein Btru_071932 [Bulinus truncatus]|nr:hypothetical protein Btru_071932 [Bulinus truncatus]